MKIERYSPGGYGAMCKDDSGDWVRLPDIDSMVKKALANAKASVVMAARVINSDNGGELREAKVYIAMIEEENTVLRQRVHDLALKVVALEMEAANGK